MQQFPHMNNPLPLLFLPFVPPCLVLLVSLVGSSANIRSFTAEIRSKGRSYYATP
jgi:hypothetical protein